MRYYADLHIHSRYSRATSRDCDLEHLSYWASKKGLTVLGTGDFTHPGWLDEIKTKLVPAEPGLFRLRPDLEREIQRTLPTNCRRETRFLLSVEISTIYKKGERTRKVHHLVYAPSVEAVEKINAALARIGNIRSDGRPILGLDSRHLLEIVLDAGEECYLVPAHIWTPWFSVLGSKSGFDTVTECYGDLAQHIFAVETGLSSDPAMNWRVSGLDRYRLVSNSDAHSPPKVGREACAFDTGLDYFSIRAALETGRGYEGSVEFFPDEGKYHLDGHRKCNVRFSPEQSRLHNHVCPVCRKPLTLGVMYRVAELADRAQDQRPAGAKDFSSLIPLPEMIAETLRVGPNSKRVLRLYEDTLHKGGAELCLLKDLPLEDVRSAAGPLLTEAISRMRQGQVIREAGYDGVYGVIRLFSEAELRQGATVSMLFDDRNKPQKLAATAPFMASGAHASQGDSASQDGAQGRLFASETHENAPWTPLMISSLDAEQSRAVSSIAGPVLIIAGPGSGKTRTLAHRIARLVSVEEADPRSCLTITFTRRAAGEMRDRLKLLLPETWRDIPVLTFHGLGFQLVQENRVALGLPRGFRIVSDLERKSYVMETFGLPERKTQRILQALSLCKRGSASPEPRESQLFAVWSFFEAQREREGWLDYDDLLRLPVSLLQESEDLRAFYRERYRFVSIDEYQDIDESQYRLVQQLVPHDGHLCAIGDPDQAIYGFRGADVGFFLRFGQDFPTAKTVRLNRNYRCGSSILSASTQMMASSTLGERREIVPLIGDTGKVVIYQAPTERAEAEFVVQSIEQLIGGLSFFSFDSQRSGMPSATSYSFADFAVLYRTESLSQPLEEAFARSGIPFRRYSHGHLSDDPLVAELLEKLRRTPAGSTIPERIRTACKDVKWPEAQRDAVLQAIGPLADRCGDDLSLFLSEIAMGHSIDRWNPRADFVSLLTLHTAKGLEFPVVFIVGCEAGILPLQWGRRTSASELAEERRLFYVGMTRAKERLFLVHARKRSWHGRQKQQPPSPFLFDMEEHLLERLEPWTARTPRGDREHQLKLF